MSNAGFGTGFVVINLDFLSNTSPLKTKFICTIFISVDIFSLKYRPNGKNSVRNCLTKYRKNKMPALLM